MDNSVTVWFCSAVLSYSTDHGIYHLYRADLFCYCFCTCSYILLRLQSAFIDFFSSLSSLKISPSTSKISSPNQSRLWPDDKKGVDRSSTVVARDTTEGEYFAIHLIDNTAIKLYIHFWVSHFFKQKLSMLLKLAGHARSPKPQPQVSEEGISRAIAITGIYNTL